MSDKYKHSEQLDDVLRYLNNTMTDAERYKLEREIERDPFLYEAFEGLSGYKGSEIDRDIRSMDVISGKRRLSLGFLKYVGYAAGIILIVFAGFWAFQSIDFSKNEIAKNDIPAESNELREPYKPVQTDTIDSLQTETTTTSLVADSRLTGTNNGVPGTEQLPKTEKPAAPKETAKKKNAIVNAGQQAALVAEEKSIEAQDNIERAVISNADETTATDENEIQIVEVAEEPTNALKRPGVNAQPQPLGGNTLFKNYIESNTRYPEGIQNAKKEYVKIKFKITKTGTPYGFVIEKSPDNLFSQEAIRIIQNGPRWSPEIKDGIPVEGEVTLRINFKP